MADPIIRICKRGSRPAIQSRYRRDCVQRASKAIESCQFAPVTVRANGMPCASTTICRLVSSFPRSVGLGPVSWPPGGWPHWPHQYWHGSNQFGRARAAFAAGPGAASPRLRRPASRAVDASTSSRCQSPVLAATPPGDVHLQNIQDAVQRRLIIDQAGPLPFRVGTNFGIRGSSAAHNS